MVQRITSAPSTITPVKPNAGTFSNSIVRFPHFRPVVHIPLRPRRWWAIPVGYPLAARNATRYSGPVKIRHKGLRVLHERDDRTRLSPHLVARLRRILLRLQEATHPGSADAPGFRLHPLKGGRAGQWSVRVSGNWRVVFRFEDAEVVDVDLVDYH